MRMGARNVWTGKLVNVTAAGHEADALIKASDVMVGRD